MPTEVKLPELGENITAGDVVKVLVKVGDSVTVDQPLLELETDKASFDVPSPVAGVVAKVNAEEGKSVKVGEVIAVVDEEGQKGEESKEKKDDDSDGKKEEESKGKKDKDPDSEADEEPEEIEEEESKTEKDDDSKEKKDDDSEEIKDDDSKEKKDDDSKGDEEEQPATGVSAGVRRSIPKNQMAPPPPVPGPREGVPVPAAPSVRMFARELGVDITQVKGSGVGGRISEDDVKKFVKSVLASGSATASGGMMAAGAPRPELPDFSAWGPITRESMSKVRRRTAEHMEVSGAIPTVTQHDKADVTRLEELRKAWAKKAERAGTKLTVTAIAMKVAAAALKKFPQFNASIDMANGEIIFKQYVHLGVAVDTERGLLVPVVRDADKKNILAISVDIQELAEKARGKKIKPDDMQGATFTITNLGGIGGTSFTPIINSPEVAILGLARGAIEPVYIDGQFQPRLMLPLSLTYDHRIIDGADAARFLRWIAEALEEPLLMALEG